MGFAGVSGDGFLKTEVSALRANLDVVQFELDRLKRLLFRARSERLESLGEAQSGWLIDTPQPPQRDVPKRQVIVSASRGKSKRELLPAHLLSEIEIVDLPDTEKARPCYGGARHVIGETVIAKLDYVPASVRVRQTCRPKYACRECEGQTVQAPLPPSPIEQSLAAARLIAHVGIAQFADHCPLNRQSAILRRDTGTELLVSTLCDWVLGGAEALAPLYEHLVRTLLRADILHDDDVIVPLRQ